MPRTAEKRRTSNVGNDDAPRVLVIPGLNGHPGLLMRYAPMLFPGWRATAFDHHSDVGDGGVEGLAWRALDSLGQDDSRVIVCGESFGGTVALTMAHVRPQRVKGLILLSAFGRYPSRLARRGMGALAVWSFLGQRVNNTVYHAGRLASLPTQLGLRYPRGLFQSYMWRPRAHVAAYRAKIELSLAFDARTWLGSLACPTFVLSGRWDTVVPASAGRELARSIPNASFHTLPGGHLVHLVHARLVGELIADWARYLH
jgi:pimeloyl-ACP methyl ester carboxylesterase